MVKKRTKISSDEEEALVQNLLLDGEYDPLPRRPQLPERPYTSWNDFTHPYTEDFLDYTWVEPQTFGTLKRKLDETSGFRAGRDASLPMHILDSSASMAQSKKARKRRRRLERLQRSHPDAVNYQEEPWSEALYSTSFAGPSTSASLPPLSISDSRHCPTPRSSSLHAYLPFQPPGLADQDFNELEDETILDNEQVSSSSWVSSMAMAAEVPSTREMDDPYVSAQTETNSPTLPPPNHLSPVILPPIHLPLTISAPFDGLSPNVGLSPALPAKPPPPLTIGMHPDPDPKSKHGIFHLTKPLTYLNPARTLVMENLPKKYRNLDFIRAWTKDVCDVEPLHAQINPTIAKALIEFSKASLARIAWASPRLGGSKMGKGHDLRHVRVWWYRVDGVGPSEGVGELEEGEIDGDTVDDDNVPAVVPLLVPQSEMEHSKKQRKAKHRKEKQSALQRGPSSSNTTHGEERHDCAIAISTRNASRTDDRLSSPTSCLSESNVQSRDLGHPPIDPLLPTNRKPHVVTIVEPCPLPIPLPEPHPTESFVPSSCPRKSSSPHLGPPMCSADIPSTSCSTMDLDTDLHSPTPEALYGQNDSSAMTEAATMISSSASPEPHISNIVLSTPSEPRAMKNAPKGPTFNQRALLAREKELQERIAKKKSEVAASPLISGRVLPPTEENQKAMEENLRQRVLQTQRQKLATSRPLQPPPSPPASASSGRSVSTTPRPATPKCLPSENMPPISGVVQVTPGSLDDLAASFIAETIQTVIAPVAVAPPSKNQSSVMSGLLAKQQILEHLIAETKKLMSQLGQARTKQEKDEIRALMRANSRAMDDALAASTSTATRAPFGNHIGHNNMQTKPMHPCWTRWPQLEQQGSMIIVSEDEDSDMEG